MIHAIVLRLPIQQEETEETEDRVRLRRLRCLLFTAPGVRTRPDAAERQDQRREPAAVDARFVSEGIGWLPFAGPSLFGAATLPANSFSASFAGA